jgi:hypothetical protein
MPHSARDETQCKGARSEPDWRSEAGDSEPDRRCSGISDRRVES